MRTILVTGVSTGIGKAIAEELLKTEEFLVIGSARNKNDAEYLKSKFEKTFYEVIFDVTKKEEIHNARKEVDDFLASNNSYLSCLINNAGVIHTSLFQMTKIEDLRKTFETNFFSTFLFTQYIIKLMIKNKSQSSIINITSSAAIEANRGRSAYASSKAALITLSKVMSKELSNFNIRVNAIAPGLTNTDMMQNSTDKKHILETINRISQKRIAEPEEIANSALFLASDLSSYINGQVIRVDGGLHE